jgi:hypothetical protein
MLINFIFRGSFVTLYTWNYENAPWKISNTWKYQKPKLNNPTQTPLPTQHVHASRHWTQTCILLHCPCNKHQLKIFNNQQQKSHLYRKKHTNKNKLVLYMHIYIYICTFVIEINWSVSFSLLRFWKSCLVLVLKSSGCFHRVYLCL